MDEQAREVVATARGLILAAGRGDGEGAQVLLPMADPQSASVVAVLAALTHRLLAAAARRQRVTVSRLLDDLEPALLHKPTEGDN